MTRRRALGGNTPVLDKNNTQEGTELETTKP